MKPLVYYCRWNEATLRLRGRDETAVWGQLIFNSDGTASAQTFHYDLQARLLTLEEGEAKKQIQLDEMGIAI